jgi:hypothetical protein
MNAFDSSGAEYINFNAQKFIYLYIETLNLY